MSHPSSPEPFSPVTNKAHAMPSGIQTRLPDNAYRELKPGETYIPMVPADQIVPEVSVRSIVFGVIMNILFAMAATYLALKAGQGIETAIPISILAVGLSGVLARMGGRRSSLLENVNILAIGTTSGIVAGGTCFTMPAIYMLGMDKTMGGLQLFLLIFLVPFLGAVLGVLFLVPFRRYFVREMHGKLPFPEGTATNEILATGASGAAGQAWTLIYSFIIAGLYNFASVAMKLFSGTFSTGRIGGEDSAPVLAFPVDGSKLSQAYVKLTESAKAVFTMGTGAYFLGLGYIVGLRYATIIFCGSILSCFVIVPLFAHFDLPTLQTLNSQIKDTSPEQIWRNIPRIIGIGGIFAAGILSILKMSGVIVTALREALGSLGKSRTGERVPRTEEDLSYPALIGIGLATTIALFLYFKFAVMSSMEHSTWLAFVATVLALVLSFLFTTVSAWAIAMISTTPLSGMTVTTIIITAVALIAFGLPKGSAGMMAVLLVGGVVCTALSMAGTLVTEFKIGYWIGATPKRIQTTAIIASLLGSIFVTGTIMILAKTPGYVATAAHPDPLPAPQANMMKSALETFVGADAVIPWTLYATGAVVAIMLLFLGISPLAFALGMYLPMEVNSPLVLGGFLAYLLSKGTRDEKLLKARNDKGILIASGLIAGAAIMDVSLNGLTILDESRKLGLMKALDVTHYFSKAYIESGQWLRMQNFLGLLAFCALALLMYLDCRRAKPTE